MKGNLTTKQSRFVDEYLVDCNAWRAAERAGYKDPSKGNQLVRYSKIASAIAERKAALAKKLEVKSDKVLHEYLRLGFSDIGQVIDFTNGTLRLRSPCDIPEDARRAIASIKVKRVIEGTGDDAKEVEIIEFKFWDKLQALNSLARHLNLFAAEEREKAKAAIPLHAADYLPIELQRQVLEAIREHNKPKQVPLLPNPDVENASSP